MDSDPTRNAQPPTNQTPLRIMTVIATALLAVTVYLVATQLNQRNMLRPRTILVETAGRPTVGASTLQNTVVIYTDFQCPYCQQFHFETQENLEKALSGKAKVVYLNRVLFGEPSFRAAVAAECAFRAEGLEGYRKASTQLYAEARIRGHADTTWLTDPKLRALVQPADSKAFAACQASPAVRTLLLSENQSISEQGGNTTPGVLVNNKTVARASVPAILSALPAPLNPGD